MARKRTNPFNVVLGVVGILFTITAMSYCVFVLRGVQAAATNSTEGRPVFEQFMDTYGTSVLVAQLAVLAVATVGAVAVDNVDGQRERARRQEAAQRTRSADLPSTASNTAEVTTSPAASLPGKSAS
jgi:Tfp pilus assembly protein PilE